MIATWSAALAAEWTRARRGEMAAVHRARTSSRRLRELLPVADGIVADRDIHRARRDMRKVTRALAQVRELDVTLAMLADEPRPAWDPMAITAVGRDLAVRRERRQDALAVKLDRIDLGRLKARCDAVVKAVSAVDAPRAWERTLASRLKRRAARLRKLVESAGTLYAPDALHAVRIAAKKLRYTLEIARDAARVPVGSLVTTLTTVQDDLGQLHDLNVLEQRVRALAARPGNRTLGRKLNELAVTLDRESREMHAAFLAQRSGLLAVLEVARRDVASSLGRRRLPMIKITSAVRRAERRAAGA